MGRQIHHTHATAAEQLAKPIAPHLAFSGHLLSQPSDHVGDHDRDGEEQVIGIVHREDGAE